MKKRIWELDALRGLLLLGMIGIHLIYDLVDLYGILPWQLPRWYLLFKNNYGHCFLILSGVCATLGSRCVRRGLQVFACGFLCTAATALMYALGAAGKDILIYFGVLHCLGCCMMLWSLFRSWKPGWLLGVGLVLIAAGYYLQGMAFSFPWLTVVGFVPYGFASSDFFPLLPNLGFFLAGAWIGKRFYQEKRTRFPVPGKEPLPFLRWCGVHSLEIYLLHQPILAGACFLLTLT